MDGTILIADDDRTIRTVLTQAFTRAGCQVHATSSLKTLLRWVQEGRGDLVVTDVAMPDGDGIDMMAQIQNSAAHLPIIVISAQNTINTTIRASAAQAYDYLPKPFDLQELLQKSAQALAQTRRPVAPMPTAQPTPPSLETSLVGQSDVMQGVYKQIAQTMNSGLPIMIRGASGTGKTLIAQTIHQLSDQSTNWVDMGDDALQQCFGPNAPRPTYHDTTMLVEAVDTLSEKAQQNLIRLLDQNFTGFRIISTLPAGHDCPVGLTAALYYRLNVVALHLPTLENRLDDFADLITHFARDFTGFDVAGAFPPGVISQMKQAPWPGNLRQLRNIVRLMAVSPQGTPPLDMAIPDTTAPALAGQSLSAMAKAHIQRYFDQHGHDLPPPGVYQRILKEIEQPLIEIALDATNGNQAKCALLLGTNRNTLRKKIAELDIIVTRRRKTM